MDRFEELKPSERRQFIRLAAEDIVFCEEYTIPPSGDSPLETRMTNVSAGGLLIRSDRAYVLGDVLRLSFRLPGWEKYKLEFFKAAATSISKPLTVIGTVVRVDQVGDGEFEIGVCLSGMDSGHRQAVDRYIQDRVNAEKRQE